MRVRGLILKQYLYRFPIIVDDVRNDDRSSAHSMTQLELREKDVIFEELVQNMATELTQVERESKADL